MERVMLKKDIVTLTTIFENIISKNQMLDFIAAKIIIEEESE